MKQIIIGSLIVISLILFVRPSPKPKIEKVDNIIYAEPLPPLWSQINFESYDIKSEELIILYKIVEAEVTGGNIQQKRNVTHVILNRVKSKSFPNTIKEVVFQKNQFTPVTDGRYYSVDITESTIKAVTQAVEGKGEHEATFFMVRNISEKDNVSWFDSNLEFLFNDGLHEFFKRLEIDFGLLHYKTTNKITH